MAVALAVVDPSEQVCLVQFAETLGGRIVRGQQHAEIREEIGGDAGTQVFLHAGQEVVRNTADDAKVVFARDVLVMLAAQELANLEVVVRADDSSPGDAR